LRASASCTPHRHGAQVLAASVLRSFDANPLTRPPTDDDPDELRSSSDGAGDEDEESESHLDATMFPVIRD